MSDNPGVSSSDSMVGRFGNALARVGLFVVVGAVIGHASFVAASVAGLSALLIGYLCMERREE